MSGEKAGLTIARLAEAGGVGVETVRYYQRRGLLETPERPGGSGTGGGVRRYGAEEVRRLRFIRSAQVAGFTLEQIGELLALDASEDRARARALAEERLAELDVRIAELKKGRAALQGLANACATRQPRDHGHLCSRRARALQRVAGAAIQPRDAIAGTGPRVRAARRVATNALDAGRQ